jgi:DNA-binding CsgD family transcriptional regulator
VAQRARVVEQLTERFPGAAERANWTGRSTKACDWTSPRRSPTRNARVDRAVGRGASITPTELRVIWLATQGLTNPQIAERLLMSRQTVKSHVASIDRKLGVSARAERSHCFLIEHPDEH